MEELSLGLDLECFYCGKKFTNMHLIPDNVKCPDCGDRRLRVITKEESKKNIFGYED